MHDVFISHSTKDAAIADAVCHRLEDGNIRCWYAPRDVQAGIPWMRQLIQAIREASVFLLIYSEEYNQSQEVIRELTEAVSSGCTIVPFRVDQTEMNDDLAYYLRPIHWLDAINPPTQSQIESLFSHIQRVLGRDDPPPPPPPPPPDPWWKKVLKILQTPLCKGLLIFATACFFGIMHFGRSENVPPDIPETTEDTSPTFIETTKEASSESTEETTGEPEEQEISFINLSRLSGYRYPFVSAYMLPNDGEFVFVENLETGKLTMAQTQNGSVYLSGIELEYENPKGMGCVMDDGYDTIYFIDYYNYKITAYDRVSQQWTNQAGTYLELSDTEYICGTFNYVVNMLEENDHMEELGVIIFDTAPDVNCISKLINVFPDGHTVIRDVSQQKYAQVIASIEKPGSSLMLMENTDGNLCVYDDATAQTLDLTLDELRLDYLPYAGDSEAICEDDLYYLSYQNQCAQVWNLETGSRVYSRTFTDYAWVYFSGPHEIIVYNDEEGTVFRHDLETGRETLVVDLSGFEDMSISVMDFLYDPQYDICVFGFYVGQDEETGDDNWCIIITDQQGNVLASSEYLNTSNGNNFCSVYLVDNFLFADMTLVDWETAEPEDGIVTELFRAVFTVDENGNLIFE